jgi:hypothetical protein
MSLPATLQNLPLEKEGIRNLMVKHVRGKGKIGEVKL